jgi:hypothetical protein
MTTCTGSVDINTSGKSGSNFGHIFIHQSLLLGLLMMSVWTGVLKQKLRSLHRAFNLFLSNRGNDKSSREHCFGGDQRLAPMRSIGTHNESRQCITLENRRGAINYSPLSTKG